MLNKLTKQLDSAVQQIGGIDAAIEACDRMYSATFRSDAFKLSELDYFEDELYKLKLDLSIALFCSQTGEKYPNREDVDCSCNHDCDCSVDSWGYACEAFDERAEDWFMERYGNVEINGDTLIVDTCNYKGEFNNEYSLYSLAKQLPVFKSKNESFFQVNR